MGQRPHADGHRWALAPWAGLPKAEIRKGSKTIEAISSNCETMARTGRTGWDAAAIPTGGGTGGARSVTRRSVSIRYKVPTMTIPVARGHARGSRRAIPYLLFRVWFLVRADASTYRAEPRRQVNARVSLEVLGFGAGPHRLRDAASPARRPVHSGTNDNRERPTPMTSAGFSRCEPPGGRGAQFTEVPFLLRRRRAGRAVPRPPAPASGPLPRRASTPRPRRWRGPRPGPARPARR